MSGVAFKTPGPDGMIRLKYCPRTRHAKKLLKCPHIRCWNRDGRECCFIPSLNRYCDENDIEVDIGTKFRCVIFCGRMY